MQAFAKKQGKGHNGKNNQGEILVEKE